MNPLTTAVLRAGIIDPEILREMKNFGSPITIPDEALEPRERPADLLEVTRRMEDALQSEGLVLTRETDLEVFNQFLRTSENAVLYIETELDGAEQSAEFEVRVGHTPLGEYIIGWRSESIEHLLCNGRTYLFLKGEHIFFQDVRELFFGETKAFLVCTSSGKEGVHVDRA